MDVLHGVILRDGVISIVRTEDVVAQLTDYWDVNERAQIETAIKSKSADMKTPPSTYCHQPSASFFTTFQFVCSRQFKVNFCFEWKLKFRVIEKLQYCFIEVNFTVSTIYDIN